MEAEGNLNLNNHSESIVPGEVQKSDAVRSVEETTPPPRGGAGGGGEKAAEPVEETKQVAEEIKLKDKKTSSSSSRSNKKSNNNSSSNNLNSKSNSNKNKNSKKKSHTLFSTHSTKIVPIQPEKEPWTIQKSFSDTMVGTAKVAPSQGIVEKANKNGANQTNGNSAILSTTSAKDKAKPQPNKVVRGIFQLMQGKAWNTFIMCVTIYALFGDDLRVAFFDQSLDTFMYVLSFLAMLAFTLELVIFTLAKPGYYRSFYFYLDIVATVTMLFDIGFIFDPIMNAILNADSDSANGGVSQSQSQEAIGAIQASRVGTKSSRIVRIVRLVRLVRVVKLYKVSKNGDDQVDEMAEENPSLVGKKLSDKTMQRVIMVVLSMLIFVQFFDINMYSTDPTRGVHGLYRMHKSVQLEPAASFDTFVDTELKEAIQDYASMIENQELIFLHLYNVDEAKVTEYARQTEFLDTTSTDEARYQGRHPDVDYTPSADIFSSWEAVELEYRSTEYEVASVAICFDPVTRKEQFPLNSTCDSFAYFDIRGTVRVSAALNAVQTIFVMIVLTVGSLMFSADAEKLVIRPIEKMVQSVKRLADNPMNSGLDDSINNASDGEDDETVLLQRTIAKIGQLLQIGFGEAGSEIIRANMQNNSGIEPMCDGIKIEAVFGFCDIRNFTDTTECLQEKVMVYVNKVGAIVHEATHSWYGAANKNIGDAFLLVWKVNDSKKNSGGENMCDASLVAFLRSIIDLKRENGPGGCLHEYKDHPAICKRFGENNFEIRLGMGLHIGWAIEGTIGSKYKIDASYLSPNVNMASRLEAATKQFRTPLLISEDFYDSLSSKARKRCRQIDRVTVKGSIQPMGLFTVDIVSYPKTFGVPKFQDDGTRIPFDWEGDEIKAMQEGLPEEFLSLFKTAVTSYLNGDWVQCKKELEHILEIKPEDGPTVSLMIVMENRGWEAPQDWPGYRELTEK